MRQSLSELLEDIEAARQKVADLFEHLPTEVHEAPIGEGRWSPVQYLEHLVRAEEATVWRMFKAVTESRAGVDRLASPTPDEPIEEIVGRTWALKEEAPPLAVPRLGGPVAYWLLRLRMNGALAPAFVEMVREDELDAIAYPHPISGPFTMRQGLQFIRFHMDRHRMQLTDAGLPGS